MIFKIGIGYFKEKKEIFETLQYIFCTVSGLAKTPRIFFRFSRDMSRTISRWVESFKDSRVFQKTETKNLDFYMNLSTFL